MPKRYGRAHRSFLDGVSTGLSISHLSMQLQVMRNQRNQTVEEFAKNCNVSAAFIEGIERCDLRTYFRSTLSDYMNVAMYCDIAVDARFKSMLDTLKGSVLTIARGFEEEIAPRVVDTTIQFNGAVSFDIPGKGLVYAVMNPLECKNFDHLYAKPVIINGNKYTVKGVEYSKGMTSTIKAGAPIGLIVVKCDDVQNQSTTSI